MNDRINDLLLRIHQLQEELEDELEARRQRFQYTLERHRVRFERQVVEVHKQFRTSVPRFVIDARLRDLLLAPVIYSMILPLLLLDLTLILYQQVYFRAYGIRRARRGDYIVIDRHQLAYLNGIEKFNCVYCGYANGLFALAREVGARTERFWCPIKHARRVAEPHNHYAEFFEYGDAEGYRRYRAELRKKAQQEAS